MKKIELKKTLLLILLASLFVSLTVMNKGTQAFATTQKMTLIGDNNVENALVSTQHIDAPTPTVIPPWGVQLYGNVYDLGVGGGDAQGFPLYAQIHI